MPELDDLESLPVIAGAAMYTDPPGQRFQFTDTNRAEAWFTVVGVSEPVLHHQLGGDPELDVYRPHTQSAAGGAYYVVRTSGDPRAIAAAATTAVGRIDPNQSFPDVRTYDDRARRRISRATRAARRAARAPRRSAPRGGRLPARRVR